MSFLDNLENNLNALERQEQKDPEQAKRERERSEAERNAAMLRAPHARALKESAFTSELLTQSRSIGREQRVLVRFTWLDERLRLDAGAKRLEFTPASEGIVATFQQDGAETGREMVNLQSANAEALVRRWLAG